jgi:hypothetical protein
VRVTWREESYTEDFERHEMEGYGTGAFLLLGSVWVTERPFARDGSANMFIGPEPVFDMFFCYV